MGPENPISTRVVIHKELLLSITHSPIGTMMVVLQLWALLTVATFMVAGESFTNG